MGDAMKAIDIVRLADERGIDAVRAEFGCTRQQAENVVTRARVRVENGDTVGGIKTPSRIGRAVSTAESLTLPGANVDPSERTYEAQANRQRRYTLEKNVANGYREYEYELKKMGTSTTIQEVPNNAG
jgi:hypothetical protein